MIEQLGGLGVVTGALALVLFVFVLNYGVLWLTASIAERRNHSWGGALFLAWVFGVVGLIFVALFLKKLPFPMKGAPVIQCPRCHVNQFVTLGAIEADCHQCQHHIVLDFSDQSPAEGERSLVGTR
jgi:hypothetical protein